MYTYFDNIPLPEKETGIESKPINVGIVTATHLNFRKSPNGSIKGELLEGTETEVTRRTGNWCHVKIEGWVSGSYVRRA